MAKLKSKEVKINSVKMPVIKSDCDHPFKYQESTFGGGVVCMKCKKLI